MVGVTVSVVAIGATLWAMNKGLEQFRPANIAVDYASSPAGVNS